MVQKWVPSAFKDIEDDKEKKQVHTRKNDSNNEQAAAKEMKIIPPSNKYELSGTQEMIDDMRLRYKDSFLKNKMVNILKNLLAISINLTQTQHGKPTID